MDKNTPVKHKTPNYKLVTHVAPEPAWISKARRTYSQWEAMPLRAGRKDLHVRD